MKHCLLRCALLFALVANAGATDSVRLTDLTAKPQISKTLTGAEAAKIVKAFNNLHWDHTTGKRCHTPGYRIEVQAGDSARVDATVCYVCWNVRFVQPGDRGLAGFIASDDEAKHFLELLKDVFARHDKT